MKETVFYILAVSIQVLIVRGGIFLSFFILTFQRLKNPYRRLSLTPPTSDRSYFTIR
ncbi:hypothetical protein [Coleofasciculus sp. E2-BRE-01]|uniref:hypothetical protein n=1 Tax=Coleofasciculus sp. E2-BRE-01 TaxID=3069524 RepID=UPI0033051AF9